MEGMTDLQAYMFTGVGVVIGLVLTVITSKAKDILKKIKESETELDDKLVLAIIEAAHEQGIVSDALLKKVKDELAK